MLKYAQCMRSHGVVNFPGPSSNGTISVGGTVSRSPQYPAADETCRKLLPNGGVPTDAQQAQGIAQLLTLSVCMRAHAVSDYPGRLLRLKQDDIHARVDSRSTTENLLTNSCRGFPGSRPLIRRTRRLAAVRAITP